MLCVTQGETLMMKIPSGQKLLASAIYQVFPGQCMVISTLPY